MNSTDRGQAHTTETRLSYRVTRNAQSHRLTDNKVTRFIRLRVIH